MTKEEFLRCLWCRMVVLLKRADRTCGQGCAPGLWGGNYRLWGGFPKELSYT